MIYDLQELGFIMEIEDAGAASGWYILFVDKQAETKFAICYIYITAIKTFYFRVFQRRTINFQFQVKTRTYYNVIKFHIVNKFDLLKDVPVGLVEATIFFYENTDIPY